MDRFTGSLDELKSIVVSAGLDGTWSQIEHGYQFRSKRNGILNWYESKGTIVLQGPKDGKEELRQKLSNPHSPAPAAEVPAQAAPIEKPRVFVVHGHDDIAREQLELVLHRLGLEPFVLANTGGGGLTLIEALERELTAPANRPHFGIVLMTPDDMGYARRDGEVGSQYRARQNVVLEMGMLLTALKRPNVAILKKGHLEVPSDAQGIIYIPFNDHVKETVPKLADRLQCAGFALTSEAIARAAS